MIPDPIVEEVRAIRDEIAKEHDYDIDAIFESLRRRDATTTTKHVSFPARKVADFDPEDSSLVRDTA